MFVAWTVAAWAILAMLLGQAGPLPPQVPMVMEPPAATGPTPQTLPEQPDLILAAILLTTLPGSPEPLPTEEEFPAMRVAVHQMAIQWEILDTRETSYIFAKRSDFDSDLNLLRRRYQDFKDAPRLDESSRLPERKLVNELVQFNRLFRKHLAERHLLEQDRQEIYAEVMIETDRLYKVWDAVRDARCDFYYVSVRRQALLRLKEMLGEEDYRDVNLPPNVPTWRWRWIDE